MNKYIYDYIKIWNSTSKWIGTDAFRTKSQIGIEQATMVWSNTELTLGTNGAQISSYLICAVGRCNIRTPVISAPFGLTQLSIQTIRAFQFRFKSQNQTFNRNKSKLQLEMSKYFLTWNPQNFNAKIKLPMEKQVVQNEFHSNNPCFQFADSNFGLTKN